MLFGRPLIAIDIGSSSIKVIETTGRISKHLRAIGLETLPDGAVVDGVIQDRDTVTAVLRDLMKRLRISTSGRRAAISLGGNSVLIKRVLIPTASDVDFEEQVYYEAEQHFQLDMAEIYYDHCRLGQGRGPSGETPVLLIGAKRDMVESHIACIHGAGLRPGVIECDVFSVANMFEYNYGVVPGLVAIVNVGSSSSQVSMMANGEYLYTRDVPIGGDEYTRRICEQMSVDKRQAEALKIAAGQGEGSVPEDLSQILSEINDQLVSEIKMTVDFYLQSGDLSPDSSVLNYIFLTGGGCRILGLDAALAAAMQLPVQITNPFQRVEVNPRRFQMDYMMLQGHLYGVAVGLAMRTMNDGE